MIPENSDNQPFITAPGTVFAAPDQPAPRMPFAGNAAPGGHSMPGGGGMTGYSMPGARRESRMEGCSEQIESQDIEMFSYSGPKNSFFFGEKEDGKIHVGCSGGSYSARDGSAFRISLMPDLSVPEEAERAEILLDELQSTVVSDRVSAGNGYSLEIGGLGDTVSIKYKSGEKIYKHSNQGRTVSDETVSKFYMSFLKYVKSYGLDFSTEGSNVKIYDDADEEYVQGTWKGTLFGSEIMLVFEGRHVRIYNNGSLTDDCDYSITNGCIRTAELRDPGPGGKYRGDEFDYEEFSEISCITKHNYFSMDAYFSKNIYSNCTLYNFDKKDPDNK